VPVGAPVEPDADVPAIGLLARVETLVSTGPAAVLRVTIRVRWAGWSASRRRATIAIGAALLALVVAISVVPGPAVPVAPVAGPTEEPADLADPGPSALPAEEAVITGDDPVAALRKLVARRERCFREVSVLCLDGVDELGSSALDEDRAAVRAILEGGTEPSRLSLASATLVERLGDSALVDLGPGSDPASVLLLKGEAGWRIRDYLAAAGGEPG
jgi:eukaryotic-like serine/threonine-protein kinase